MKEEYKRRQLIMKMAGYNVPQDGNWGPYQQSIWKKINTREKEYKPTIWGLLLKGYDTITGNTTYTKPEATVTDLGGRPDKDTRTHAERNADYLHPIWGANERWKASMSNNTNPLVGVGRTIVPAVVGAVGAHYLPQVVGGAVRAVPQAVRMASLHPHLVGKAVKTGAWNFGKSLTKGIIGGKAVDLGSEILTDKSWGELVAPYLGVSEGLADWTNPGYLLGGTNWGISNSVKKYRTNKKLMSELQAKDSEFEQQIQLVNTQRLALEEAIKLLNNLRQELLTKHEKAWSDALEAESLVSKYRPISKEALKQRRQAIALNNKAFQGDLNVENRRVSIDIDQTPVDKDIETLGASYPISFTNPNGKTATSSLTILPKPEGNIYISGLDIPFKILNGKLLQEYDKVILTRLGRFGNIIEGDVSDVLNNIGKYVDQLENIMGEDGTVAGSLIHYKNGILKGTLVDSSLIGPADTEIYTTAARLPQLQNKLQFVYSRENSTGGLKGTSPFTFRNNDAMHKDLDTEINIIEADSNGNAKGKIAHLIYRALWPEKYSKMLYDSTMSGKQVPSTSMSLPISAENLLLHLKKNPQAMQLHLLVDMIGMETFTRPLNIKASKRLFSVLFNPDNLTPLYLHDALLRHGKYNLGSQFKLGSELYPNITFTNVEANKQFLKAAFNLSDEELSKVASNPDIVRNAFDLYNFQHSTGTRLLGNDVITGLAENGERLHDPFIEMFFGNGSFSGGTGSGPGLNTALLNPFGGWHPGLSDRGVSRNTLAISQRPLTYHPEKILTPMDLVNQVEHLKEFPNRGFYEEELAGNVRDKSVPYKYNKQRMLEIEDLSKLEDKPVYLGMNNYGFGYSGGFAKPISTGARFVTESDYPELGSMFKDIVEHNEASSRWEKLEEVPLSVKDYLEFLLLKGTEGINNFILLWKNADAATRAELLKKNNIVLGSLEGDPYMSFNILDAIPRSTKRRSWDYSEVGAPLSEGTISAREIQEGVRPGWARGYHFNENGEYVESTLEELLEMLKKSARLWSEYIRHYKLLRRDAYLANLKEQAAGLEYRKAGKNLRDMRGRLTILLISKLNKIKGLRDTNSSLLNLAQSEKEKAVSNLKGTAIKAGMFSLGLPLHALIMNSREMTREDRMHAHKEQVGMENPNNGYYEFVLRKQNLSEKEIELRLELARRLYNNKLAMRK